MVSLILSPCLYLKNNEFTNVGELVEVLEFIDSFLVSDLVLSDASVLSENNWYSLPKYKPTVYNQFTTLVVPLLRSMLNSKRINTVSNIGVSQNYSILDSNYSITDKSEFDSVINCISQTNSECLLFLGSVNSDVSDVFALVITGKEFKVKTVKNVWLDESGYFDHLIKECVKDYNSVFPCKLLCSKMKFDSLEIGNKSLFKKYAGVIAKRNGYSKLKYSSRQYKDVPYYMRDDGKYVLCVDTLHGSFEVFQKIGSTYENYVGEYDFQGNEITQKSSSPETHICYKSY